MPYKDKAKQSAYQLERIRRRRAEWFAEHGPCKQCGSWNDLEVDHIDPSTKVSHRIWNWSLVRRLAELAKCQVLCKTCHKEKSDAAMTKPIVHGTLSGYRTKGCRCDDCRRATVDHQRQYMRNKKPL